MVISVTKAINSSTFLTTLTTKAVCLPIPSVGGSGHGGLHSFPMKYLYVLAAVAYLILPGCRPSGHGVQQTMFHKDIYLHLPPTAFSETNRRSIRVLPHTWINIKRLSAVLSDGTIIPCRDFKPGVFELVQDDNHAQLIGTLDLPVPAVAEVMIVINKSGQCSGAEDASLHPCTLESATAINNNSSAAVPSDEATLTYTLPSRDRETGRLVLQLAAKRDKQQPTALIPITLTSSGQLPVSLDAVISPWISPTPSGDATSRRLPYGLLWQPDLVQMPNLLKGTIDPDSKAFSPMVMFDAAEPERIAIGGTVVRLDVAKKTFQLRVSDTSNGQPYGTLFFRVDDRVSYALTGSRNPVSATFDDLSIGRQIWVTLLANPDPNDRLYAMEVRILDRSAKQR